MAAIESRSGFSVLKLCTTANLSDFAASIDNAALSLPVAAFLPHPWPPPLDGHPSPTTRQFE